MVVEYHGLSVGNRSNEIWFYVFQNFLRLEWLILECSMTQWVLQSQAVCNHRNWGPESEAVHWVSSVFHIAIFTAVPNQLLCRILAYTSIYYYARWQNEKRWSTKHTTHQPGFILTQFYQFTLSIAVLHLNTINEKCSTSHLIGNPIHCGRPLIEILG